MKRYCGETCPCGKCEGPNIRNCTATDYELAQLAKARKLSGPKLVAMMPTWLKAALYKAPKPFVFVPDKKPVYPHLPRPGDPNPGPDPFKDDMLREAKTTASYVAAWNAAKGLKG